MSQLSEPVAALPRSPAPAAPGVRPTNPFVEFSKAEIEQSIPARFEQQVAQYPDRLAVKTKAHRLTYAALNRLANRVAHAVLARRGEGAEPIALLLEHDAPLIAALLGVLKAGKFHVPLDPSYPRARLAYMVQDSGAGLIVSGDRLLATAGSLAGAGCELLNVDALEPGQSTENPGLAISPDAYAYILYTSGSTGQPKGVIENHRDVLYFTWISTNSYHLSPTDRVTLFQSCSFSGSVAPLYGALLNGAALLPLNLKALGVARLADWLAREEISVFVGGPELTHLLALLTGRERFPKLRLIHRGGIPLYRSEVELFQRRFSPGCILVNSLAATERKCICQYFIDHETRISGSLAPIGYPTEDTEVLLLGEDGRPLGFDACGEIAVKSRYLSPGYWGRPDLTRATFQSDPAGGEARLWRTGDLGRRRPDGCLEHLGRKDFQVKIRGYRVELAEIEQALLDLDGIKEAVVVAREDGPGEQRLLAYVVPVTGPAPGIAEWREQLRATLPEYMLPSGFVLLDRLPRTPSDKVDRRALPAPGRARPELEQAYVAPRGPLEALLAAIWAEVLRLEQVGIRDEFLALGGDSLLVTRLVARVRDALQAELPLGPLLESATVAEMAAAILQIRAEQEPDELARLLARSTDAGRA